MTEQYGFDAPTVSRDEATELCVYHLRMAAALYQVVPDDENKSLIDEINRQCANGIDDTDLEPAKAWAHLMFCAYERMKDDD